MWELYSGEALYEGMTVGQVLYAVVYDAKRPPIPDGCPPEYAALMRDCWKGDPVDRCACRAARRPCNDACSPRQQASPCCPPCCLVNLQGCGVSTTLQTSVVLPQLHLQPQLTPHPR